MARISLVEQYQNKDVITQIYELKDTVGGFDTDIEQAKQAAASASSDAQSAKTLAQDALAQTNTFDARIKQAQEDAHLALTQAEEAQTDADGALAVVEVQTTATSGTLYQKQVNNVERGTAIPIASATASGLMNAQTYKSLSSMDARISALEGKQSIVYVTFASDSPSQSEITAVFTSTAGRAPVKGDIADDIARALIYQYDGVQWIKTQSVAAKWSNDTAGLVKGTPAGGAAGTLFAETDGTGSVNGWDALSTKADNAYATGQQNTANITVNANAIAAVKKTADANTAEIEAVKKSSEAGLAGKQVKLKTATVILTAGGWASNVQTVDCAIATADNILWVAPADNVTAYGDAGIYASAQSGGKLTFTATTTPSVAFTVSVVAADL